MIRGSAHVHTCLSMSMHPKVQTYSECETCTLLLQVAGNMLHLGRVAMHKSNRLRKVNISEARGELDKAKFHVDNSIRLN